MMKSWIKKSTNVLTHDLLIVQERQLILQGTVAARQLPQLSVDSLRDVEFSVFSQGGEDGILQYLIQQIPGIHPSFVEFGVEDYRESNTRFLLMKDRWQGWILDGGESHLQYLHETGLGWRYPVQAISKFITRENISSILAEAGVPADLGILSIDIDGNDYWVWEAIEAVRPSIVVIEYNATWGADRAVSIPYQADFDRTRAHYSNLYFGASLLALEKLGEKKGYALVGTNRDGMNAFFVRKDQLGRLKSVSAKQAFTAASFAESRDSEGRLTLIRDSQQKRKLLQDLPLVDLSQNKTIQVKDL